MKSRDKTGGFIKALLAAFLIATHAKLLYWIDPIYEGDDMIRFSYLDINEKTVQAMVLAFLFGSITVYILTKIEQSNLFKVFVVTIAILDGLVVQLLYNDLFPEMLKVVFVSSHYTIYTIFIILVIGLNGRKKEAGANCANAMQMQSTAPTAKNANIERIKQLKEEGKEPNEIARELQINPSTVYRNIKKIEENAK